MAVFDGRGRSYERRTYPELLASCRTAAGRWKTLGLGPGDRVVVSLPTSWAWLESWVGAMLVGALPVAVAPGAAMGAAEAHIRRLDQLVELLTPRHVVGGVGLQRDAERHGVIRLQEVLISPAELADATPDDSSGPAVEPSNTAFLQLTSGSTGLSRAVMISHRAALHNPYASDHAIGVPRGAPVHQWAESMVSWLPLHHDMGLAGCLLMSIYCGLDLWLLPPTAFLARPRLWLQHFGEHGVAFAPAPNFAYQLCVERIDAQQRAGLDLSFWSDAMTGAEMIRPETIDDFCDAFVPHGFRPEVFRPCYGLAEGTLAVTFDLKGLGARTRPVPADTESSLGMSKVVCVGEPVLDTEVRIAAPDGRPLAEGEIGEVHAKGPGIFSGYYNDPKATSDGLRDGWLYSGDLGFLDGNELYITGRLKDLLILQGNNLMPHEIEWVAESVTGGGGAVRSGAFSIMGSRGEEAILVVETAEKDPTVRKTLAKDIRHRVGRSLSLPLADLVFVRRGKIPKTTSGKVQRRILRDQYQSGTLERL